MAMQVSHPLSQLQRWQSVVPSYFRGGDEVLLNLLHKANFWPTLDQ